MGSLAIQDRTAAQRRTLSVLFTMQVLAGCGLAGGMTAGPLLATQMLGSPALAGLPIAMFPAGSAVAAVLIGRISQTRGRRIGLASGSIVGAFGASVAVLAAVVGSVPLLCAGFFLFGSGFAANLQARFAGADLAPPERRGFAVSIVLVASAVGAAVGPNLVSVSAHFAEGLGVAALAGPFMVGAVAFVAAAALLWLMLRPDPLLLARELASAEDSRQVDSASAETDTRAVTAAALIMILTQVAMVAVMTMTPVHMVGTGHDLSATGIVISVHVVMMYLPAPLSGWLVDRVGTTPVAIAAGLVMLTSGVLAAMFSESIPGLAVALGLLGFGWSLGLVSGTTMLTNALPLSTRAKTQGVVDLGVALAGAFAGLGAGLVIASTGYSVLALSSGIIAVAIVPFAAAHAARARSRVVAPSLR